MLFFTCASFCLSGPGRVLFTFLFDHLHEPPVLPFLFSLFQSVVDRKVRTREMAKPTDIIAVFKAEKIMNKIAQRVVNSPTASRLVSQASSDFLLQLIEKILAEQTEAAASDLARLVEDISEKGQLVDQLTSALTKPGQREPWQLANISAVLNAILAGTANEDTTVQDTDVNSQALAQMMGNAVSLQKKITNTLYPMKNGVHTAVSSKLTDLTKQLITGETPSTDSSSSSALSSSTPTATPVVLSAYTVIPFTSARVQLFKLLVSLVRSDIDSVVHEVEALHLKRTRNPHGDYPSYSSIFLRPRLFQQIQPDVWKVMIQWFFRYLHNNFYLGGFRNLLLPILQLTVAASKFKEEERKLNNGASGNSGCCTDETLKFLFDDVRLLDRMIAFYTDSSAIASCTSSFILEICNHLRFSADLVTHQSFLYTYLQGNDRWQAFLPRLREESLKQSANLHVRPFQEDPKESNRAALERALGFSLSGGESSPPANPNAFITPEGYGEGIDLGSVFAWHMNYKEKSPFGVVTGKDKKKLKKKQKKKAAKKKKAGADGDGGEEQKDGEDEDGEGEDETDDGSQSDASSTSASPIKKHASASPPTLSVPPSSIAKDFSDAVTPSPPISPMLQNSTTTNNSNPTPTATAGKSPNKKKKGKQ